MLTKIKAEKHDSYSKLLFDLNNATYHTASEIIELFHLLHLNYVFAPAYLSPLTPIEYFLGVVKKRLRHYNLLNK